MKGHSGRVLAVNIVFWVLSWLFVSLRVYVRTCKLKAFGADDWTMLVTLGFFTAYLTCQLGGVVHGTGRMRKDITDADAQIALEFWWFCEIFYSCSTGALKVSVGLFLLRITTNRWHIRIIWTLCFATILVCTVYFFIALFQCKPISYWWDLDPTHHGTCIGPNPIMIASYAVAILNSIADWSFGILPIFIVKQLHMRTQTKFIVGGILSIAAVGCLATLIRMPYVKQFKGSKGEWLWYTTELAVWSTVEVGIGIVAASMPTLRPILQPMLERLGIEVSKGERSAPYSHKINGSSSRSGQTSRKRGFSNSGFNTEDLNLISRNGDMNGTVTAMAGGLEDDLHALRSESNAGVYKSVQVSFTEESSAV